MKRTAGRMEGGRVIFCADAVGHNTDSTPFDVLTFYYEPAEVKWLIVFISFSRALMSFNFLL